MITKADWPKVSIQSSKQFVANTKGTVQIARERHSGEGEQFRGQSHSISFLRDFSLLHLAPEPETWLSLQQLRRGMGLGAWLRGGGGWSSGGGGGGGFSGFSGRRRKFSVGGGAGSSW